MNASTDSTRDRQFADALKKLHQQKLSPQQAMEIARDRLSRRKEHFLAFLQQAVFSNAHSPYKQLFELAGCEWGDVSRMVESGGIEPTLQTLREAGVYLSFDEFKRRTPLIRQGTEIPLPPDTFHSGQGVSLNVCTSGTTGDAAISSINLDDIVHTSPVAILAEHAHHCSGSPTAFLLSAPPAVAGLHGYLRGLVAGNIPQSWFSPVIGQDIDPGQSENLTENYLFSISRELGCAIPTPSYLPIDDPKALLDWIGLKLNNEGRCTVLTYVSMALRVCIAAQTRGLDLSQVTFIVGGEPLTPAKAKAIWATGARLLPRYASAETGTLAVGCANPTDEADLHLAMDYLALIQPPIDDDSRLAPFYITTLNPGAPSLLLNVESDDCGIVEERDCGCLLHQCGYTQHLRKIRSYRKLTGEAVNLPTAELVHIVEVDLPKRYGGAPVDYQIIEEEDEQGLTRLTLRVDPRIEVADESAMAETVLNILHQGSLEERFAAAFWHRANSLRISREPPAWDKSGKFRPVRLLHH